MYLRITLLYQFEQQRDETWDLHFSSDGKRLISSDGQALYLWRLQRGGNRSYEHLLPIQKADILRFAPDVVRYVERGWIKLLSFEGTERARFPLPPSHFWAVTPDLRWLVSSDPAHTLLLWDLLSHQHVSLPLPFPPSDQPRRGTDVSGEPVGRFLFSPECQQVVLFADSPKGSLHICAFDPEHQRLRLQKTLPGMIDGIISPDGKLLAIILSNGEVFDYREDIFLYDLATLRLLHVFPQTTDVRPCLLAFSPDSKYVMSGKTDGWVDIFSVETFACVAQFAAHPGLSSHATDPLGGLDWSKTGYIATGGASVFEEEMDKADYSIKIWRVEEE